MIEKFKAKSTFVNVQMKDFFSVVACCLLLPENRDNLVLKAVYFLFILVILAHERFVRKKKTFPEPKIILQRSRNGS